MTEKKKNAGFYAAVANDDEDYLCFNCGNGPEEPPEACCWWCCPEHHEKPVDAAQWELTPEEEERMVAQGMLYITTKLAEMTLLGPNPTLVSPAANSPETRTSSR